MTGCTSGFRPLALDCWMAGLISTAAVMREGAADYKIAGVAGTTAGCFRSPDRLEAIITPSSLAVWRDGECRGNGGAAFRLICCANLANRPFETVLDIWLDLALLDDGAADAMAASTGGDRIIVRDLIARALPPPRYRHSRVEMLMKLPSATAPSGLRFDQYWRSRTLRAEWSVSRLPRTQPRTRFLDQRRR